MRQQKKCRLARGYSSAPELARISSIEDNEERMLAIPAYANSRERIPAISAPQDR